MRFKTLLLSGLMALVTSQAMGTIVDGVRQQPTYQTTGFVVNTEAYLYNVGAGQFFTEGNSWGTQASVGQTGLLVKFEATGNDDYYLWDESITRGGWFKTFFDSETALFVDLNNQLNYYFAIETQGETFRIFTSSRNPEFGEYAGAKLYVGLLKNTSSTALSPFVDEDEAYVDWAFVTEENYNALASEIEIYNKAQELKTWIDRIAAENGDVTSLSAVYLDEGSTLAQLQAAIDTAQPLYIKALVNNAPDKENVDVTLALVNPDYEQGETGWTVVATSGSGANGRQGNVRPGGSATNQCYEAWNNSNFDIYQTLADMPVGVYEIEVQGFYRYGRGATAWDAYQAQNVEYVKPEGVPVYIYLNNNATNFVNVFGDDKQITNSSFYSGSNDVVSHSKGGTTYYFPDGMASAAIAFSDGMYKQSAYGLIANEGDPFRIGVKGNSSQLNDSWVIWDNFKLYYRGFKPEVVQPILETAMADLNQYANMLMGKTEYATLSQALTDAQTAIDTQDGEAMFAALNALYDVKEAVIASKDLFLENEVAADLASLQEAIDGVGQQKMSQATLAAANKVKTDIATNQYENTEISQLKTDVDNAIYNISASISIYADLNTAIATLTTTATQKAQQALITEANELLSTAQPGYNNGTFTDAEADATLRQCNTMTAVINSSAQTYVNLQAEINKLTTNIAEAEEETVRVSQTTLNNAKQTLTETQALYNDATINSDAITTRIAAIETLIEDLMHSINLYKEFLTSLQSLQTALAKTDKMSVATRTAAQDLYDTDYTAYDEGTVDDDQIENTKNALNAQVTAINNSIAAYKQLAQAIPTIQAVINLKAYQEYVDAANTLYTEASTGYDEGSIADADINGIISNINTVAAQVQASALLYTDLAAAISDLEDGIALATEESTRVAKSTLTRANLRLTGTQTLYDEGTITDANIPARIELINQLIDELTYSIRLYQQFLAALDDLQTALATEDKMYAATRTAAQTAYDDGYAAYEAGTVDDDQIETQVASLTAHITAITNSIAQYVKLSNAIPTLQAVVDLKAMQTLVDEANTLYTSTTTGYANCSIADADIDGIVSHINTLAPQVQASAALYADLAAAITRLDDAVTAASDESTRLAKSTLNRASQQLTNSQELYNAGTIADADIPALITAMDQLIPEIEQSIVLYSQFNSGLETLAGKLATTDKMSAATKATAQDVYDTAFAAYEAGTINDDGIAEQLSALATQGINIENSIYYYTQLYQAISSLKTEIDKNNKVAAATLTAAKSAYNSANKAYKNGTLADNKVNGRITTLNNQETALANSAVLYAQLAEAITTYDAAIADANGQVSSTMLTNATTLQTSVQEGYNDASITDADVPATITNIQIAGNNLRAAFGVQAKADAVNVALTNALNSLNQIGTDLTQAKADVNDCYIAADDKAAVTAQLTTITANHGTLTSEVAEYVTRNHDDVSALTAATNELTTDHTAAIANAAADFDDLIASLSGIQPDIDNMAAYLAIEPAQSIAASANIIDLTAQYGTFCSTASLNFTEVEDIRAYIVSTYVPDGNKVIMTRVNVVPAGTGIVVVGTPGGHYEIPKTTAAAVVSNLLVGTTRRITLEKTTGDKTNCILASGSNGIGFYPTSGGELAPAKAYLPLPTAILEQAIDAKGVKIVFDDATRLEELRNAELDGTWYSVGGQKLSKKPTQPGVYVKDGRKVVVK